MTRATAMAQHPAGILTDDGIRARAEALRLEEEGLAYLVPVDRIIAAIGGILGGSILAALILRAAVKDALRIPRR